MSADALLLRRYLDSRDESAFAEFVRRHVDLVYFAALRRTGDNAALARDVAQQVFSEAARRAAALARHPTVEGWLYTATRNLAHKLLRDERARRSREREFSAMQAITGSAPAVDWERLQPWIDGALDELGAADREALVLRFFGGRTFADVGAAIRISEDAARMRVDRALGRLRTRLEKRGLSSTTALLAAALGQHALHAAPATLAASLASGALAAGPGAAVAAWGLAAFMSSTKVLTGAAVAALLLVGVAVHEGREERLLRASADAARRETQTLTATVAQAKQRTATLRRELAIAPPPPAPAEPWPLASLSATDLGQALMEADPELKRAAFVLGKATARSEYFPLYRELNLTEAQIDAFEAIAGRGSSTIFSVTGLPSVVLDPFPKLTQGEREEQLRAILGEAGLRRLEEYRPVRDFSTPMIAAELAFTSTPLRPEQARQLWELVALHRAQPPVGLASAAQTWDALVAESARFLSAPQIAAVEHQRARVLSNVANAQALKTPAR